MVPPIAFQLQLFCNPSSSSLVISQAASSFKLLNACWLFTQCGRIWIQLCILSQLSVLEYSFFSLRC